MLNMPDIQERIETDFDDKAHHIVTILKNAVASTPELNDARIIRCIVFLADRNLEKLLEMIVAATADPRDVMYWAEYIHRDLPDKMQRVRDFSKPFSEASLHPDLPVS